MGSLCIETLLSEHMVTRLGQDVTAPSSEHVLTRVCPGSVVEFSEHIVTRLGHFRRVFLLNPFIGL